MPMGIIDEPGLIVETVLEMADDEGHHVMVGRDNGEVGAVLGFLETNELLHTQLFVEYATAGVAHFKYVRVGSITFYP